MSEYETHIGKCKRVFIGDEDSIEQFCRDKLLNEFDTEYDAEFYSSYREQLMEDFSNEYVIIGNSIYKILEDKSFENEEIIHASKSINNEIKYVLYWYNGGAGFNEVLEEAIENMEK
jgi:hypothetical protein